MKLKDQVCSLELAKKLKEMGVEQESAFYWEGELVGFFQFSTPQDRYSYQRKWKATYGEMYSAFTAAELGNILPGEFTKDNFTYHLNSWWHSKDEWQVGYCLYGGEASWQGQVFTGTEADARAKLLIYLIEQKILIP